MSKPSSFWIPTKAVEILLENNATALEIAAYLTLASHTEKNGAYSTAGEKKVHAATGASRGYGKKKGRAAEVIDQLTRYGRPDEKPKRRKSGSGEGYPPGELEKLIYRAEDYTRMTGIELPELPTIYRFQYIINQFRADPLEDGIWFDRSIIDGIGKFKHPLKRLVGCGDHAARLLLKLQETQTRTIMDFAGVQPFRNVYQKYSVSETPVATTHGFTCWISAVDSLFAYTSLTLPVLKLHRFDSKEAVKQKQLEAFWKALEALKLSGFIEEILTVFNLDPENEDAIPIYEITVKNQHGNIKENDQQFLFLARFTQIFKQLKLSDRILDSAGRIINYPVISRIGNPPHVAGIYRTRFRANNYRQFSVKETLQRRKANFDEWDEEIRYLESKIGISQTPQRHPAHKEHEDGQSTIVPPEQDRDSIFGNPNDDKDIEFF